MNEKLYPYQSGTLSLFHCFRYLTDKLSQRYTYIQFFQNKKFGIVVEGQFIFSVRKPLPYFSLLEKAESKNKILIRFFSKIFVFLLCQSIQAKINGLPRGSYQHVNSLYSSNGVMTTIRRQKIRDSKIYSEFNVSVLLK